MIMTEDEVRKKMQEGFDKVTTKVADMTNILSAKGFDIGTVNSELNRMEEKLKKLREEDV